ncbi:MAG: SGNH/GDSL hydrolase family protein [Bacteroidota bacterium]|nr:SGNH/GDSL hydrolase family protein [Bacteroidota bacterium]
MRNLICSGYLKSIGITLIILLQTISAQSQISQQGKSAGKPKGSITYPLIPANNSNIQYTGRIDFSNKACPRFSSPGVYIQAKFTGTLCDIELSDPNNHNYIEVVVDNGPAKRIKVENGIMRVAEGLANKTHTILICKDTEAAIGWLEFKGFRCKRLLPMAQKQVRKIECYGNSITCGAKMIAGLCEQGTGDNWNITNKAYMSYGAVTARKLNAQWQLTSWSGIGLVHSCCNMPVTMPDVYDRTFLENPSSAKWDFSSYIPDVVTICLGQNDGIIDSSVFCSKYVEFILSIRAKYPHAAIFCLTSPMSDDALLQFQKKCLSTIVHTMNAEKNDSKVYQVILTNKLNSGCGNHPDEAQHELIARELSKAIKEKLGW